MIEVGWICHLNGTCELECDPGFYKSNPDNGVCDSECYETCYTCSGSKEDDCLLCPDGYLPKDGECLKKRGAVENAFLGVTGTILVGLPVSMIGMGIIMFVRS